MNSFIGISRQHTTNLAVVAPGIAEALLATALGLVAAIPAVVMYNMLGAHDRRLPRAIRRRRRRDPAPVSRDLDRARAARPSAARVVSGRVSHGRAFRPRRRNSTETHEINVTPFIDVILVLLIIFMIAAPLSTVDIAVDLPDVKRGAEPPPEKPIT